MGGFVATMMAMAMIAAFLLAIGGIRLAMRRGERGRGLLMLTAAAVIAANLMIWTL